MRPQRISQIEDYIIQQKVVTLDKLCAVFHISKSTLRRDLTEVLKNKEIQKVYGGVSYHPKMPLISFEQRNIKNIKDKREIANKAASYVKSGDIIFIDSGTTTLYMLDGLKDKKNLTVITNNLEFIFHALPYENITLFSLPGIIDRQTLSFTGTDAANILENYNISKAFMATTGFSMQSGVTNSSPTESKIKQVAVTRSQQVFLLADSTKFNTVSLITYCELGQIDTLITDKFPPTDISKALEQKRVKVVLADNSADLPSDFHN